MLAGAIILGLSPAAGYADPGQPDPHRLTSRADIDREISAASDRLNIVVEAYNATRENLTATEAQIKDAEKGVAPLRAEVDKLRGEAGLIAAGMYRTGDASILNALLTAASAGDVLDRLAVVDHMGHRHRQAIDALDAARERLETRTRTLTALKRQQTTQAHDLDQQRDKIESDLDALHSLRGRAHGGRITRAAYRDTYVPVFTDDAAGRALRYAYQQIGKPYRWAGEGPGGFDCSGLTKAAWQAAGKTLPHNSRMQWDTVTHISRADLRPGDLVFYYRDIHHVAIYAGAGRVIVAPQDGDRVRMAPIDVAAIYGYGRVTA